MKTTRSAGTMKYAGRLLALLCPILFTNLPTAVGDYPIKITDVKVGFPPGPFSKHVDENGRPQFLFKPGKEAPIWIDYEILAPLPDDSKIVFVIETPDGDGLLQQEKIVVRASDLANRIRPIMKLGGIKTEVSVRVHDEETRKELAANYRTRVQGISTGRYLILGVGADFKGLRLPKNEGSINESVGETTDPLRNGWVELAAVPDIDSWWSIKTSGDEEAQRRRLPLAAVDVVLFATGDAASGSPSKDFPGQEELLRWVERGGHAVIGVGRDVETIRRMPLNQLLPVNLVGTTEVSSIPMVFPNSPRMVMPAGPQGKISVARTAPKAGHRHTVRLVSDDAVNPLPLVVQSGYGLGRVTVVLFDPESPPLANWKNREAFWDWLLNAAGPKLPSGAERLIDTTSAEKEDQYRDLLDVNLDTFEGIPVISFGWVALLLLAYLLLIGPVERYLLRRFFKRLEWTWLTFPVIVIAVCLLVWSAARDSKGHDVKVDKIDLIDVDLASQTVYGRSWFALFSPKNQNYDIALESTEGQPAAVNWSGQARGNQLAIFRRSYGRNESSAGLDGVPLQTWSTKQFAAHWSSSTSRRPWFDSTLHVAEGDPTQITGSITSNLPIELITDAQLMYREKITPVPALMPGVPRYLSTSPQSGSATAWLLIASDFKDPAGSRIGKARPGESESPPPFRLWPILQHELTLGQFAQLQNASFRDLDQSWRVSDKNPDQAILLARIGAAETSAEQMNRNPANPTRIKLNDSLTFPGTIRQETYLRVIIPIVPAK